MDTSVVEVVDVDVDVEGVIVRLSFDSASSVVSYSVSHSV